MTDPQQLTNLEVFWLGTLVVLIVRELLQARSHARRIELFKPTIILAAVLVYYAVAGPLRAIAIEDTIDRTINRRADFVYGWAGAAVFYASTLVGFHLLGTPRLNRRQLVVNDPERIYRFGTTLCQLGLALFSVVAGIRLFAYINPFAARELLRGTQGGIFGGDGLSNYFLLALNFLIPGICLQFTTWVCNRRHLPQIVGWLLVALGIFTSLGFRFRIVLVVVPMLLIWYLVRNKRPNPGAVALIVVGLIFMAGFVGLTRGYGRGLDVSAVEERTNEEIFEEGFGEAHVFFTTSGMIAATPAFNPYVGIQPLLSVLQFPIPRAWYPDKDTFGYLERSMQNLYNSTTLGLGAAVLCYGEWFLMAGWPSLILMSLLFGWLLRCLWNWTLIRRHEPLALAVYALVVSYFYLVVSRGYLAQVVAGAVFTLGPLFWIYRRWSRPVLPPRAVPSLPRG
ncbi:MAG: hypothetical protein KFB97_11165 [Cyanobium sp. M30B3]|nr:MAG: hypothetical protein KFB97_11165 [Cyanobium sp. M30B3]